MADLDPDALLTASQLAAYFGVSVAAVVNWATRGYRDPQTGEHTRLEVARRPDGTPRRDGHRCLLYRLIDGAKAEAATAAAAGRLFPVAA